MIACLDSDYRSVQAQCACLLFRHWEDETPFKTYRVVLDQIADYEPGAFYKRELPCLLKVLAQVEEPVETLIIDGYVWLGDNRGGMGWHLHRSLPHPIPVIGVAKTKFQGSENIAIPVLRGTSKNPLWITAVGMDPREAAQKVSRMAGQFRIPNLLKTTDAACRDWSHAE